MEVCDLLRCMARSATQQARRKHRHQAMHPASAPSETQERRTSIIPGTRTVPASQTRPRSLRRRSTIIKFSARSFSLLASRAAMAASRTGSSASRAAVPLMGRASRVPSRLKRRKRSGLEQQTTGLPCSALARVSTQFTWLCRASSGHWLTVARVKSMTDITWPSRQARIARLARN